jgi:hypothetical protein
MREVKLHDAVERMMRNGASRWPGRGARNRLEPECWPEMNPSFHLYPGSTVFTIGSCFARNVERHLEALGFEVPMRKFLAENATLQPLNDYELVTKYTPPSIYQELAWTKRIRDRDGIVTDEDIEPFLLDLGNGRFIDLQRRYQREFGASREEVLALRRILYGVFEKAFDCDAVIVTLGLIECWLDTKTGQYVEFSDNLTQHADKDRFVFRRLTFQEAYDFTRNSIDLLGADGKRSVLLTASPVPIMRTFTGDDVIIANTYSKSVLRAVAGQIAEEYPNVDYLPGGHAYKAGQCLVGRSQACRAGIRRPPRGAHVRTLCRGDGRQDQNRPVRTGAEHCQPCQARPFRRRARGIRQSYARRCPDIASGERAGGC